jgi:hypothetical protein
MREPVRPIGLGLLNSAKIKQIALLRENFVVLAINILLARGKILISLVLAIA